MRVPTSSRLTFTPVAETDRSFLEACWNDDEMRRYLGGPMPLEKRDRIFQVFVVSDSCWVLRLRDGSPVGTGIVVDTDGTKELGIELVERARGVGLGREACEAMLDWLAEQGVAEVIAIVQEPNEASRGLFRALGGTEHARYEKWGSPQIEYRITLGPVTEP